MKRKLKATPDLTATPEPSNHIVYTPWPSEDADIYRAKGYWQGQNIFQCFLKSAEAFADRFAILAPTPTRYSELKTQVLSVAITLTLRGIQPQDTVVLQLPNGPAAIQYLLACFAVGAVPVMALPAHRSRELNHCLNMSKAKAFIAMQHDTGEIGGFKSLNDIDWQGEIIAVTNSTISVTNSTLKSLYTPAIDADDVALLQLSGGTTGLPKLIPRTHNDYVYSIQASNKICQVNESSVFLCLLPAAHNFTLSSPGILGTLFAGGALVLGEHLSADEAFEAIQQYTITHIALVPPLALNWLNYYRLNNRMDKPLASLTSLLVGGAKLNSTSAKALMKELGAPLQQVFGMAEGLVNYTRLQDSLEKRCNTQGKPLSDLDEILVVDDDDIPVAVGERGHLLTKGPYTIRGYLYASEHNQKAFTHEGFYRTGDIVSVDNDGYLTVEGRDKDQINRGGEKISAAEIEDYLLQHSNIADVAVIAIEDEYLGERIGAYLVTVTKQAITLVECRKFLLQFDIAEYKLPDKVVCITQMPKTSFGKVSKKKLRQMARDNSVNPISAPV